MPNLSTTIDYIEFAIAKCKKDIERAKKAQDLALGTDLTSETLSDPKYKARWDKYFAKSTDQKMKELDTAMNKHVALSLVLDDLNFILLSEKLRNSKS